MAEKSSENDPQSDVEQVLMVAAESNEESVPDGGFIAWIQCASSFSLFMGTWGIANSFGVFQTYYEKTFPHISASSISWIGSIHLALLIALGVVTGPLFDYGYLRSLVCIGSFLSVLGMIMISISTQYWHLVVSQGVLLGIGSGCLFIPSIAVLPTYFSKKQTLVLGIGSSGAALGGIIFPIIFQHLQPRIGFAWSIRVIAFIMLLIFIVPVLGMKMRVRPSTTRRMFDLQAWKELPFFLSGIFLFLVFLGAYIPSFYIQLYGAANKVDIGFYLIPILNAGSMFGRLIPPYIADTAGVFNTEIVCVTLTGILAFAWVAVHNTAGLIVYTITYGFFSGALTSLSPNIAIALSPDIGLLGVRLGMLLIPIAFGLLFGNPIAGAISSIGWLDLQLFTGAAVLFATIVIINVRLLIYGWSWRIKC